MPLLRIITNVNTSKIPKDFVDKAIPVFANALGKPARKFVCTISADTPISFGGDSQAPAAIATLVSIGKMGPDENVIITKALSDFVEKEIGVPSDRFLLWFNDVEPWDIGINKSTAYQQKLHLQ